MILMPFDTETSDLIEDYKMRSNDPRQPHTVQLAALLVDSETREELGSFNRIIKPDGWEISPGAFKQHGISMERAMDEGQPAADVMEDFVSFWKQAELRIAHNTTFDNRMVRIGMMRHLPEGKQKEDLMKIWKEVKTAYFCTMVKSRSLYGKWSTLSLVYETLMGEPLEGAHDAMNDARAALAIYFKLIERGIT